MTKTLIFFHAFVLTLVLSTANASEKHCSLISDHTQRLSCYQHQADAKSEDWLVAKSKYFDSITVSNSAMHEVMCGDVVGSISIVFTCAEGETKLAISSSCIMGVKNEKIDVQFQTDDRDSFTEKLEVPNNKYSLITSNEQNAIHILKQLIDGDQMHLTLLHPVHVPFTATFNGKKLASAAKPLRVACGW